MWGRNKKNINTVALYKKLAGEESKPVNQEESKLFNLIAAVFGSDESSLNILQWFGILNELKFCDLLALSAVDKQARFEFVRCDRYHGMFFSSVYNGRINALITNKERLETAFGNQMARQWVLARRQDRPEDQLAYWRRKCLHVQVGFFGVAAMISLMFVTAFSRRHSDDTSLENARLDSARIDAAISFGVFAAFGALVVGLLRYSILRTRPYKPSQIRAFLKETEELRSSLPEVLPESEEEWEAAFHKLVALENRVDKKLDHLDRLSNRDVEAQPEMSERALLVRNRF